MATSGKGFFRAAYDMFRPTQQVTVANQSAPAPTAAPAAKTEEPSDPLAKLAAVWKNDPNKAAPVDPLAGPILNPDTSKIVEAAKKVDLLAEADPELLQKATSGDGAALVQLIQLAAQASLATGSQIAAATTEQGLQRQTQRIVQALPGRIKEHAIASTQATNPILQNPAAAPFLEMTKRNIAASNPHLTPAEITAQAEAALLNFGQALAGNQDDGSYREGGIPRQSQQQGPGTDWGKWAGVD